MRIKYKKLLIKATLIVMTICLLFNTNNKIVFADEVGSSAKAMCVIDGVTNTVLYSKNADAKLAMASTTKIMTAIAVLENIDNLNTMVNVHDKAIGIEGTSIYLQKGEVLSVEELLYALILASANDSAVALAYHVGETEDNFVKIMNDLAVKIGANYTNFINPHGLDAEGHYTTAKDLALITSYAMKNSDFKTIVSTKQRQITGNEKSGMRYLRNKNRLVFYQHNNVGVKTGFTDDAGRCLVNAVEDKGMLIITVLLNCGPMFEEAQRLTDLALNDYKVKEFVSPYNYIGSIDVENGDKNKTSVISIKGYKIPIKKDDDSSYEIVYDLPELLKAPISVNDDIGEVRVYYLGELVFSEKLYSIDEIENVDIKYMLNNIIDKWF